MRGRFKGIRIRQCGSAWIARDMTRRVWLGVCIVALGSLLASCGSVVGQQELPTPTPLPPQPAVEKPTYTVARGDIVDELRLSGRVAAVLEEDLHFAQAGNVVDVYARATDPVTKGQLLAELDQGDRLNQLAQAQLTLDQAKLALQRAQARQRYAVRLAEIDLEEARTRLRLATAAGDRELAQIGVRRAEVQLQEARAGTDEDLEKQVDQAQLDYDRIKAQVDAARLYATFDGEVAAISVRPGAAVEPYRPVLTIMDPRERELRIDTTIGVDISPLSPQQAVTIRFSRYPDQPVEGIIERLPQGAAAAQTTEQLDTAIHISFDPGNLDLNIGDLATVIVTLQRKENVLWLPPQAVRTFQGRRFVVVKDGTRSRRADIKLGITGPERVEVAEGLEEGQVVVGQ